MFLPLFEYSPEEIFKGEILLFDVDFFNPQDKIYVATEVVTTNSTTFNNTGGEAQTSPNNSTNTVEKVREFTDKKTLYKELDGTAAESEEQDVNGATIKTSKQENIKYFFYLRDPDLGTVEDNRIITSPQNSALELQPLVSQWYSAIRNIAIVASMSVLLYVGIRMLLATVSQEKAKYKQMLTDWVVGVCLLFFMHYIMAFSVTIVEAVNDIISSTKDEKNQVVLLEDDSEHYISSKLKEIGREELISEEDPNNILWPTNLMGALRLKAQVSYGDMAFVGYGIGYAVLVLFTLYFTYVYLRRVLYMAFLTMIAPLVALTYPIDKISDGQAQGFNKWLKEYIFNLLLQPLHLLLYTLLVTSAYDLAATNALYSIVAIAFMIPAEKLMRSLFGFEKATTPGSAAGAVAGATMLSSGLQRLLHRPPPDKGGKGGQGSGDEEDSSSNRIGFKDAMQGGIGDGTEDNGQPVQLDDTSRDRASQQFDNTPRIRTSQQAMLDAYDENYGTNEWNPLERDQMARDADTDTQGMQYSEDEYRQILRDSNPDATEEEIDQQMAEYWGSTNDDQPEQIEQSTQSDQRGEPRQQQQMGQRRQQQQPRQQQRRVRRPRLPIHSSNRKTLQRLGNVAKYTASDAMRQAPQKLKDVGKKATRTAAKAAVGATVGAFAAGVGATIGLATGDPSKVASFAAGAGAAGGMLGASRVNPQDSNTKTAAQIARERAYWGDDYDRHVAEENIKNWKKDNNKRRKLESILGVERTKELYEQKLNENDQDIAIDKYLKNEVAKEEDIAAADLLQRNDGLTFEEAMLVQDAHSKYGDITKIERDKREGIRQDYIDKFSRNTSQEQATRKAEKLMKWTNKFDQYQKQ